MNTLDRLQKWYLEQANGDWEHTYGITIENVDNPGWLVTIDLNDTNLEKKHYQSVSINAGHPNGWMFCEKLTTQDNKIQFRGSCSIELLDDTLRSFLNWSNF